jgi:hypothetical protein
MTNHVDLLASDRSGVPATAERRGLRRILEPLAIGLMLLGYVMIFQPFALIVFTYSYTVMLIGTALYMIASHLRE